MGDSWYASAWHIAAVKTVDAWGLYVSFVSEYNMKQQIQSFHGAIMAVAQLADAPSCRVGRCGCILSALLRTGSLLPPYGSW